jgi:hypothetical protein
MEFYEKVKNSMHCFFFLCNVFFFESKKKGLSFDFGGTSKSARDEKKHDDFWRRLTKLKNPQKPKMNKIFMIEKKKQCIEQKNNA